MRHELLTRQKRRSIFSLRWNWPCAAGLAVLESSALGCSLGVSAACALCYAAAALHHVALAANEARTPNPAKAPIYFLSPLELAVCGWPRCSGIIGAWLLLGSERRVCVVLCGRRASSRSTGGE